MKKTYQNNSVNLPDKSKVRRLKKIKKSAECMAAAKEKERLRKEDLRTILEEEARMLIDSGYTRSDTGGSLNYNNTFFGGLDGWDEL